MAKKKYFDFIGKKKIFFLFSSCLMVVILLCTLIFGVEMDIQFKGGTLITFTYDGEMSAADIKGTTESILGQGVAVNMKGGIQGKDSFEIVLTEDQSLEAEKLDELSAQLKETYTDNNLELLNNTSVEPTIGRELFAKSMVAVSFAAVVLIIYIALRFKKISGWSAGVMAIIALLNDLITVFGVFVIFRIPLDYNFIAVLLTILGYSVNDTIVIYDRIRENNRLYGKTMDRNTLVNNSINETLTRTINTTVTTLIAMISVTVVSLVMGVDSIMSFAFPMTIGLISGTYTTICLAGPLWVTWQNHKEKKHNSGGPSYVKKHKK